MIAAYLAEQRHPLELMLIFYFVIPYLSLRLLFLGFRAPSLSEREERVIVFSTSSSDFFRPNKYLKEREVPSVVLRSQLALKESAVQISTCPATDDFRH